MVPISLTYSKISKHPRIFLRLFGVNPDQAREIIKKVEPLWEKQILQKYKRPGRPFKIELTEMVLMVLLYYRSYMTHLTIGWMFGVDDSTVCRMIRRLEPILATMMRLKKDRTLTQEDVELLIDATEQSIERPQKRQKPYYSGKKKRHTVKTEIRTTLEGKIVHVSKTRPGSTHDLTVYRNEIPLPRGAKSYVDSGYMGLQKDNPHTEVPFKKTKKTPLSPEDKAYNTALARIRVKVENVLSQIKTFKIMADRYRNKRKRYSVKFKIIAGIVNLKNGFSPF
jgi:hypothetical protein